MKTNFYFYTIKELKQYLIQSNEVDIKEMKNSTPCSIRNIDRIKFSDELLETYYPDMAKEEASSKFKEYLPSIFQPGMYADSFINFKIFYCGNCNPYPNVDGAVLQGIFNNPKYEKPDTKKEGFLRNINLIIELLKKIPDDIINYTSEELKLLNMNSLLEFQKIRQS